MSLRLFAAIAIPDDIAERLCAIQRGVSGARWRPRENFHITLSFFGDVLEPVARDLDVALESVALRTPPFDVQLKGAGFFGGGEPSALIIKVAPAPALVRLAQDCFKAARSLGVKADAQKYSPHLTLAYLGRTELARVIAFERAHALFAPPPFSVTEFGIYSSVLRNSAPSLYRLEADYPLSG